MVFTHCGPFLQPLSIFQFATDVASIPIDGLSGVEMA
jgi:hypothetical protein